MTKDTDNYNQNLLHSRLKQMEQELHVLKSKNKLVEGQLTAYRREFYLARNIIEQLSNMKNGGIVVAKAIPAYALRRRNIKKIYSKSYKLKDARNRLKKYKQYLYDLGFESRALKDLHRLYMYESNVYLKKAAAWELAMWYSNKQTVDGAKQALPYLEVASRNETNLDVLRQIAIQKAEAHRMLGHQDKGLRILKQVLINSNNNIHTDVLLAIANLCSNENDRLFWINEVMKVYDLEPITLSGIGEKSLYHRLHSYHTPIQENKLPKVTIIIPAYNSELGIEVTLHSLVNQLWENLEIIVVNDCSTDKTVEEVKKWMKIDERISLLSTAANSGPYVARNIALREATGEFVTINDADDWAHPQKIEKQVRHLLSDESVIANSSKHIRVTEDLLIHRRGQEGKYIFSNMSSIMFRRTKVMKKVGYWDPVRFAGDSEYKKRLIRVFGEEKIVDLNTGPLGLSLQSEGSLTGGSVYGYSGFMKGARKEYAEAHQYAHAHMNTYYLPYNIEERFFPVPSPMKPNRSKDAKHMVDIAFVADFRILDTFICNQLEQFKEQGYKVGLIQMGKYDLGLKKLIHTNYREMIDGIHVEMLVYGEKVYSDLTIVYNPLVFQERQSYVPELSTKVTRVIVNEVPNNKDSNYNLRKCAQQIQQYTKCKTKWMPLNQTVREQLSEKQATVLRYIQLSHENWKLENNCKCPNISDWVL
ncbi:glycosyltransferase family 2 protein [Oceanobacillus kimchii]|uniref:glycosyltransferase family 2 protein n=1 Tax=Oceanobacillus kimchii TaxID=746691 RepID=UPI003B01F6A8